MRHISHIIQSALDVNRYQLTNAQLQDLEKRLFLKKLINSPEIIEQRERKERAKRFFQKNR